MLYLLKLKSLSIERERERERERSQNVLLCLSCTYQTNKKDGLDFEVVTSTWCALCRVYND